MRIISYNLNKTQESKMKNIKCSVCNIIISETGYPIYFDLEDDPQREYPLCIDCYSEKEIADEIVWIEREQGNAEEIRRLR